MEESSLKINTKMHYKTVQEDFEWLVSQYENGNFILLKIFNDMTKKNLG